jgi:KilA-N domain
VEIQNNKLPPNGVSSSNQIIHRLNHKSMEVLNFVYNDQQIEFKPNGDDNIMVNATQMAKAFGKRIDFFLKSDHAKEFISVLEFTPFGVNSAPLKREEIVSTHGQNGTFMHRILALKFAAWLDPRFELWVYTKIDEILNHYYRELRNATIEKMRVENMKTAKRNELLKKYPEFADYVELEDACKSADARKAAITRSMNKQMKFDLK